MKQIEVRSNPINQQLAIRICQRLEQIGYEVTLSILPNAQENTDERLWIEKEKTPTTILWIGEGDKVQDKEEKEKTRVFSYGKSPIETEEDLIVLAITEENTKISEENHLRKYFSREDLEKIKTCDDAYLKASVLVRRLFQNKKDKANQPYIHHLRRVSDHLEEELQIAGLLHDTVEDTEVTCFDLLEIGFSPEVVAFVYLVTKPQIDTKNKTKEEKLKIYEEEIDTIIRSKRKKVTLLKQADMEDNYNPERRKNLPKEKQEWFEEKYGKQLIKLKKINEERNQKLC